MMGANLLLPLSGLVLAALAWAAGSVWLAGVTPIAASFARVRRRFDWHGCIQCIH